MTLKLKIEKEMILDDKKIIFTPEENFNSVLKHLQRCRDLCNLLEDGKNKKVGRAEMDNRPMVSIESELYQKFSDILKPSKTGDPVLAKMIQNIRTETGMKKKDLAEKLGVTQAVIGNWEHGNNSISPKNLKAIKTAFPVLYKQALDEAKKEVGLQTPKPRSSKNK